MDGWRGWYKCSLALLCGLTGAWGLGTSDLRADVLTPSVASQPALQARGDETTPGPYLGFVPRGSLRNEAGLSGDNDFVVLYQRLVKKLADLRADLASSAVTLGMTMIGGHAQRLVAAVKPPVTTPSDPPSVTVSTPTSAAPKTPTTPPAPPTPPPTTPTTPDTPTTPPPPSGEGGPPNPPPTPNPAPEPASLVLGLVGLGMSAFVFRRRRRTQRAH